MRRKSDPTAVSPPLPNGISTMVSHSTVVGATSDHSLDRQDFITLSTAISNGDDLGPFLRRAFTSGRPDSLLQHLRLFSRSKESEIEELCKAHYSDFIRAVDDLKSLLCDVDDLKSSLSDTNRLLLSAGVPLLNSLDSFLYAKSLSNNLTLALNSARSCVDLLTICAKANYHLGNNNLYLALRAVDEIDREMVKDAEAVPLPALRRMLVRYIPAIRGYAEKKISKEFSDWMVQVRAASRHLGQVEFLS
jgi:exocyst complex component 6